MHHLFKHAMFLLLGLCLTVMADTTPQWPFDRAPIAELHQSQKKVFTHYFSPFPISVDNKDPESDYYQRGFLNDNGEGNKHLKYGGYIRQRPLPRAPRKEQDWKISDIKQEILTASELGIDGFSFDMLSIPGQGTHWKNLLIMLDAAKEIDNGFKVLLMPDMTAGFKGHPEALVPAILQLANHPSVYRDNGRVVVAPFNGYAQPPAYWVDVRNQLKAQGVDISLWLTFQGWWKYIDEFAPVMDGFSDWGTSTFSEQHNGRRNALMNHDRHNLPFMAPVRPQDFRPKNFYGSESHNSALFREMWHTAMDANAQWVQLVTWNDYSEASEIAPSTSTRHAFYDLSAYYTSWFKTGKQPAIVRDAIYYFHRIQPTTASASSPNQAKQFGVKGEVSNEIELLGFLKAPGTLSITIDGKTYTKEAPAGITSFTIPLTLGTPTFRLVRNDKPVIEKQGAWPITDQIEYSDLLVHADGGTAEVQRDYSKPEVFKTEMQYGDLIKPITTYDSTSFNKVVGDPSTVMLPTEESDKATQVEDGKGAFTLTLGPGKSHSGGKIQFGDIIKLEDGQEVVFHVKRLEIDNGGGWVAFFFTVMGERGSLNLTPRTVGETYVSSSLPKFKVERGNFKVEYPAVYRIRKTGDTIEFVYNNDVIYTADAEKAAGLDKVQVFMGSQKKEAKALMEITAIEVRKVK
jgi:hypothetical protein